MNKALNYFILLGLFLLVSACQKDHAIVNPVGLEKADKPADLGVQYLPGISGLNGSHGGTLLNKYGIRKM